MLVTVNTGSEDGQTVTVTLNGSQYTAEVESISATSTTRLLQALADGPYIH